MGNNIRILREKNKITQAELAEKINLSEYHLGAIERDEKHPSYETLSKMAEIFDITISELVGEIPLGLGIVKRISKSRVPGMIKLIAACELLSTIQICSLSKFLTTLTDSKKVSNL